MIRMGNACFRQLSTIMPREQPEVGLFGPFTNGTLAVINMPDWI